MTNYVTEKEALKMWCPFCNKRVWALTSAGVKQELTWDSCCIGVECMVFKEKVITRTEDRFYCGLSRREVLK